MVLVLITGLSGTGKSTLIAELCARGYPAYDADDGFSELRADGEWGWKVSEVEELFRQHAGRQPLFFAGCSEEQSLFSFDHKVLLTASRAVMAQRLMERTGNDHGKKPEELVAALGYIDTVEPLLRASADTVIETTRTPSAIADEVLAVVGRAEPNSRVRQTEVSTEDG